MSINIPEINNISIGTKIFGSKSRAICMWPVTSLGHISHGTISPVSTELEAEWAREPVLTFRRSRISALPELEIRMIEPSAQLLY
jgi:hypothetical protein